MIPPRIYLGTVAFWFSMAALGFSLCAFAMSLVALMLGVTHHG